LTILAGRAAGRAIDYVQLARGQFDTTMRQSQASMVSLFHSFSALNDNIIWRQNHFLQKQFYLNPSTPSAQQL
jgi:hypothetical protein